MRKQHEMYHVPVMLEEILEMFALAPGSQVLDATLGHGGHSLAFCKKVAPGGKLVGSDWDQSMIEIAKSRLNEIANVELEFIQCDYRAIASHYDHRSFDAILLDLGVNSMHLDDSTRGFSFSEDGPLDMRMDRTKSETAADFLNQSSEYQIESVLRDYGDENWARKIANVIVDRRKNTKLETTADLVSCVLEAIPPSKQEKRIHPATRTFQAIRIYINQELQSLQETFEKMALLLKEGGVMVILSYHSGEDRAAKNAFRTLGNSGDFNILTPKPLLPSQAEIHHNPRSRSAKLRAIKRVNHKEKS